jgi:hypothetical protein
MPGAALMGLRDVKLQAGRTKSRTVNFTPGKMPRTAGARNRRTAKYGWKPAPADKVINLANRRRWRTGIDVEETEDGQRRAEITDRITVSTDVILNERRRHGARLLYVLIEKARLGKS